MSRLESRIDHVAIAVPDLEAAYRTWRAEHGVGRITGSADARSAFVSRQMTFAGGAKLELIAPSPAPGRSFIDGFLDRFGSTVHHITLKVEDVGEAVARLAEEGIPTVDADLTSRPEWTEAFVSPRTTRGAIVQIASSPWSDERFSQQHGLPVVPPLPSADALRAVVVTHPDLDLAARLWDVLGASVTTTAEGLTCSWGQGALEVWVRPTGRFHPGLVIDRADQRGQTTLDFPQETAA